MWNVLYQIRDLRPRSFGSSGKACEFGAILVFFVKKNAFVGGNNSGRLSRQNENRHSMGRDGADVQ